MNTYIKGSYRKSIYSSEKGYVIGLFKVRETNDESLKDYVNKTITFTGYFYDLNEDDTFILYGEGISHPRYGFQFQVSSYEKVRPTDKEGIVEFLSSDLFPGIGEKLAHSIVETLGNDVLNDWYFLNKKFKDINNILAGEYANNNIIKRCYYYCDENTQNRYCKKIQKVTKKDLELY